MTTILAAFMLALLLSLILTPATGKLGEKFGGMDVPDGRKIHPKPIPRIGGFAIFITFILTITATKSLKTSVSDLLVLDRVTVFFLVGAAIIFAIGFLDDFKRQSNKLKFFFQIVAASIAYWGGVQIERFDFFSLTFNFEILSYFITMLWFVLFINAVNLVDGLDGLAGGIVVFAAIMMIFLSIMKADYLTGMYFAALGGATLGFLRYNFNPASVFLGDGGSYFLGYMVAGLSIMGSVKSQVGAVMMIPVLALGVPMFDTILSPVRRFLRGRKMFSPDNGHVHHRLLDMGLTTRRVVLTLYLVTVGLCIMAIALVNIRDERAGLFLIVLGAGAVIFVRKLGYFEYFATDKIFGWFKDLTDEAGLSLDRRTFLSLQIEMSRSQNFEQLWQNVIQALEMLKFDMAALYLNNPPDAIKNNRSNLSHRPASDSISNSERRRTPPLSSSVSMRKSPPDRIWSRQPFDQENDICSRCLLRMEVQLTSNGNDFGTILLLKDLKRSSMNNYTLKRVENLRRSVIDAMGKIDRGGKAGKRRSC